MQEMRPRSCPAFLCLTSESTRRTVFATGRLGGAPLAPSPRNLLVPISFVALGFVAWPTLARATLPPVRGAPPPELIESRQAGLFSLADTISASSSHLRPQDAPPLTPDGEWHIPVILVSFLGQVPPFPPARFRTMLFDTTGRMPNGSMAEYYRDVSRGKLRVTGDIVGWYALPESESYYAQNGYGLSRIAWPWNIAGLVLDACARADPDVDFSKYDRNGDGEVDYLLLVHAGIGAEAGAGNRNLLWSINSSLSGPWEFVTPYQTHDFVTGSLKNHIVVNRFSLLPERSWINPDSLAEIGPYCHEFGHGLGWPDLYDASTIGGGYNVGPGDWCLMASGAYGGDDRSPSKPTRPCAWAIQDAGWLPVTNVTQSGLLRFPPVAGPEGKIYRLWWQGDPSPEEFLIENRQRTGHDSTLPGDGLLVYHVDEGVIANNRAQNRVNAAPNVGLRVEEADGGYQLLGTFDRGSPGDPFPGSTHNMRFADDTQPATRTFDGRHTNISLSGIESDGFDMFGWAQITPLGWSPPSVTRLTGSRLATDGTRVMNRLGPGDLDFLANNLDDSSRVCVLSLRKGSHWGFPVRVSTVAGASEAAWSEQAPGGPRMALWTDVRNGVPQIFYRKWDGTPGPETRATYGRDVVGKPAGAWLPDGRFLLMWLDHSIGQVMAKVFYPGQEATAEEDVVSSQNVTNVVDYTLASSGTGRFLVVYTSTDVYGSNIYYQHWESGLYWSGISRLSYDGSDRFPTTEYMPGGLIRCTWLANDGTRSANYSVTYDPVAKAMYTDHFETFESPLPLSRPRYATGPSGLPLGFVTRATDPPNDRLQFGELEPDGQWDAALGRINGSVNVSGAEPFVDVWPDGSMHVYWLRGVTGGMELGTTYRAATVPVPVAVGPSRPASVALGATISVVPNPAVGFVTLSWSGEAPAGSRLAVYSIAGRLLARSAAGVRAMRWDGRDALGSRLGPGIYLVRLEDTAGQKLGPVGKIVWVK